MSDLFDALSTRFTATGPPAIRPRPTSRFEATETPDALVEEDSVISVRAPETASKVASQRVAQQPTQHVQNMEPSGSQLPLDTDHRSTREPLDNTPSKPERKQAQVSNHHSHHLSDDPATDNSVPVSPVNEPESEGTEAPIATEVPEAAIRHAPVEIIRDEPSARHTHREADQLRIIETHVVEAPERVHDAPEAVHFTTPDTIVHIGRVEMRQPAPPPQPAPPATPRSKPANDAARTSVSQGKDRGRSGLTDYLGWKRH
ncbi:hypothetical protein ROA7450_03106 [Roseovarius albus]|uniref:Uncharacterized protein n=1 Tax=Roseovarius albus TaxID=1247867 RepID=A0A1X6ZT17_9RHOB|nr:hypothetical protein [Roseovarius albus]SLN59955.1 hypothetical protein ROA7450_03106 [Roseovarius albus]